MLKPMLCVCSVGAVHKRTAQPRVGNSQVWCSVQQHNRSTQLIESTRSPTSGAFLSAAFMALRKNSFTANACPHVRACP